MPTTKTISPSSRVLLRLVQKVPTGTAGAVVILGASYLASWTGLNGKDGWVTGRIERRQNEEGDFSLTFPNGQGPDGVQHRRRFQVTSKDYPNYRPGDEWFEIYQVDAVGNIERLLFVGTPEKATITRATITITGWDALYTLRRVRDTAASFWCHDPRSVFEHYSRAWVADVADDFESLTLDPAWSTVQLSGATVTADADNMVLQTTVTTGFNAIASQGPASASSDRYQFTCTILDLAGVGAGSHAVNAFVGAFPAAAAATDPGQLDSLFFNVTNSASLPAGTVKVLPIAGQAGAPIAIGPGNGNAFSLPCTLKIEWDARYAYFYANGKLLAVLPTRGHNPRHATLGLYQFTGNVGTLKVSECSLRSCRPYLMRNAKLGDVRLPGAPPSGGLTGEYCDENTLAASSPTYWPKFAFNGTRQPPAGKRLDKLMEFNVNSAVAPKNFNAFAPADAQTANGDVCSLRWTGSVFLDFDTWDYAFRVRAVDDIANVWIGDCRLSQILLAGSIGADATTPWLKAGNAASGPSSGATGPLAGQRSGWYPIVIEYLNGGGPAQLHVEYSRNDGVGTWVALQDVSTGSFSLPAASVVKTSPIGIFQGNPRFDSHYNQLLELAKTFGLQFTCEPRSLESGEFPGNINPYVRIGHDTEKVLDSIEGVDIQTNVDASDTTDTLLLDGQNTGDNDGGITIEGVNYGELKKHMFISSDQDSVGDITFVPLAAQRANSLIALRSSAWQETGVKPDGKSQIIDSFPLTGALAKFAWLPGDGVRLKLPELDVIDATPRQILGVGWPISPNGIGRPDVKFRQRPRGFKYLLQEQFRQAALDRRNYQRSQATYLGSVGAFGGTGGSDPYSRLVLPDAFSDLIKLEVIVQFKNSGPTNPATIEVNSVITTLSVTAPGTFDVTSWALPNFGSQVGQRNYARLTPQVAGDVYEIQLRATVKN